MTTRSDEKQQILKHETCVVVALRYKHALDDIFLVWFWLEGNFNMKNYIEHFLIINNKNQWINY